jgi:hypothetical protein
VPGAAAGPHRRDLRVQGLPKIRRSSAAQPSGHEAPHTAGHANAGKGVHTGTKENTMATSTPSAAKYRVQLISLECVRKQDTIGKDDPQLFVNGVSVYGPGSIEKGQTVNLRPRSALFTSVANINLKEVDPGVDDDMGTVTATASDLNKGVLPGEFHRANADYKLFYQVVPA